ncbi:MAG: hypothetical protein J3R72DRAFT_486886 [Linnemannia gamsii]|nr:MAG: hypothetical protein J3R72DRAFT_486886 [Linnemannia gamsii]
MVNQEVAYITLTYISVACYLFLLGHCIRRSSNYLLRVFCVVSIITLLCETILLFVYPNHNIAPARGTVVCTISAITEQYVPLVTNLLAACMGFNVWLLVVRGSKLTERELLKWYCLFSFGVPVVTTATALLILHHIDTNFTAMPRKYFCEFGAIIVTRWTYGLPMLLAALPSVLFALHTVIYLVRHHFVLRRAIVFGGTSVRSVPFELGHCLRLIFFVIAFGAIVIMLVVQENIAAKGENSKETIELGPNRENPVFSDFTDSLSGIIFFLIFGTTKDALDTMGYIFCCGCIQRRRRRHHHSRHHGSIDNRAFRLNSTSSSLDRNTSMTRTGTGTMSGMTLQEAIGFDLESNMSTLLASSSSVADGAWGSNCPPPPMPSMQKLSSSPILLTAPPPPGAELLLVPP